MTAVTWILAVVLALACWTANTQAQGSPSHYCYKTRTSVVTYRYYTPCYYRYYWYHYYYWGWNWRWRRSWCIGRWRWRSVRRNTQYRTCCTGWSGSRCNQPVCNPKCGNGGVCISPTEGCYCKAGTAGRACETAVCSVKTDCWPGTCKGAGECYCSSGFEGEDCEEMRDGPIFNQCSTKLIVQNKLTEETVFDEVCGKPGYENYTFYTNRQDFNRISMTWDSFFHLPEDTPVKPRYLYRDVPGIIEVHGNIKLFSKENVTKWDRRVVCSHPSHATNPFLNVECRDIRELFNEPVKHLYRLEVELSGKSGGFKELHDEMKATTFNVTYVGTEVTHLLHIYFDLEPPTHCSLDQSCTEDEFLYPIFVSKDITKDEVDLVVSGWADDDTGLDIFMYEVFPMAINQNGRLEELQDHIATGDWDADENKPPVFTPPSPGMYSLILTVSDLAGNIMKARTLLLYDPESNITTNADRLLYVANAHADADFGWMHTTADDLQLTWDGLFENTFHHENNLLEAVKEFETEYEDTSGNRTIQLIPNNKGITLFEMAWTINSNEMSKVPAADNWQNMTLDAQTAVTVNRKDGDVIRLWLRATDAMGNVMVKYTTVEVDTTEPLFTLLDSKVVKNVETKRPRPLFATRVELNMVDLHSGIDEIAFEVHEIVSSNETVVINTGTEKGQKVDQTEQQCAASGQCLCIANGDCYYRLQAVYLNNCWFMDKADARFVLKFTAFNKARLSVLGEYELGSLSGIRGQGEYPPVPKETLRVSPDTLTADAAQVEWDHASACYKVTNAIVSYQHGSTDKEHTVSAKKIELSELSAGTDYTVSVLLVYEDGSKSAKQTFTFVTAAAPASPGGQSGQAAIIAGSVIGAIIVILLIVLIAVMLLRRRNHQPMIPEAVSKAKNRMTARLSMWGGHGEEGNQPDLESAAPVTSAASAGAPPAFKPVAPKTEMKVAYVNPDYNHEEDLYIYGGMDTDENARWKFASDRIDFGKLVPNAKGRFADFRFATIITKSGQETVVAKMLKASASEGDKLLMKAKMNFLGTALSFHPNVVNFIGALPDEHVLLFEYCDGGTLSEWLGNVKKVTEDVEDTFNNFAIMIANGMVFLHSKKIVHRRLGARNILLKKDKFGNLVTKVAGFGPMAGEEAKEGATFKDRVPIKYLAVEQMKKPSSGVRQYTNDTDVWTYAVTLWEIYSKGESPYPGTRTSELAEKVANGYRLPKPEYCLDFVYSEVMTECWYAKPASRPTMEGVYMCLKHHFDGNSGAVGEELYYDESEMHALEEEFYDEGCSAQGFSNGTYQQ